MEHNCTIFGGYVGKHGTITVARALVLPCAPFPEMLIKLEGQYLSVQADSVLAISWNVEDAEWTFHVEDVGDSYFKESRSIVEVASWYTSHGWKLEDVWNNTEKVLL